MFEIDAAGLAELEGGRPAYRLAMEPVANVFDEFRGYGIDGGERRKPSYCAVTLERSANPRGIELMVHDDGPGFANERDIYTLYGSTPKRSSTTVGGRFNVGEKQLIASAVRARVSTVIAGQKVSVVFEHGLRSIERTRCEGNGTTVSALLRWTIDDLAQVRERLLNVIAPEGLDYTVDGHRAYRPVKIYSAACSLPTVKLHEGLLRTTTGKTAIDVYKPIHDATLFELGMPVCSLAEIGFPYSLDVQQKVPVPISRDMVETSYLYKVIGLALEQAALDGQALVTEAEQESGFVKDALNYITQPAALQVVIKNLYGDNVVRQSSDPMANAKAAVAGATVIPGRWFGAATRKRLETNDIMPTSLAKFGGTERITGEQQSTLCPLCGGRGKV